MNTNASRKAFSLVELLIVILIIGIVAGFAVPAMQGVLRGSQLSQATAQLADSIGLARQTAISRNRVIEVRFYRFADAETPGETTEDPETGHFRGMQTFEISESGVLLPVSKMVRLPDTIMINPGIPGDGALSSLLGDDRAGTPSNPPSMLVRKTELDRASDPELPRGVGMNYEYVPFRFRPDGSTDLPPNGASSGDPKADVDRPSYEGRWFITLHSITDWKKLKEAGNDAPPPNYATLMIDPLTGTTKIFRPGLN